jgi:predicted ArsR family transcriptional regulator
VPTGDEQRRDAIADLSTLADRVRRRLYEYVAAQDGPVRRDDAATVIGISRTLAAYHLDRLAQAGLLTTGYARPAGRGGPGAGRPAKQYERVRHEVSVSVPPRNYVLLARLLAGAAAADDTGQLRLALIAAAEDEGRDIAERSTDLLSPLVRDGYEPCVVEDERIELRNCPFHAVAEQQTDLVCSLNQALVRGLLAGRGEDPGRAELAPSASRCCVVIHADAASTYDPRVGGMTADPMGVDVPRSLEQHDSSWIDRLL